MVFRQQKTPAHPLLSQHWAEYVWSDPEKVGARESSQWENKKNWDRPVAAGRVLELPNSARNTKNIFTLKMATV